jgi:23S rRNA C2498 (ribose-2'-O)-methylase RlmM
MQGCPCLVHGPPQSTTLVVKPWLISGVCRRRRVCATMAFGTRHKEVNILLQSFCYRCNMNSNELLLQV